MHFMYSWSDVLFVHFIAPLLSLFLLPFFASAAFILRLGSYYATKLHLPIRFVPNLYFPIFIASSLLKLLSECFDGFWVDVAFPEICFGKSLKPPIFLRYNCLRSFFWSTDNLSFLNPSAFATNFFHGADLNVANH